MYQEPMVGSIKESICTEHMDTDKTHRHGRLCIWRDIWARHACL